MVYKEVLIEREKTWIVMREEEEKGYIEEVKAFDSHFEQEKIGAEISYKNQLPFHVKPFKLHESSRRGKRF